MGGALMNGKVLNGFFSLLQPFADQMIGGLATEMRVHTSGNKARHNVYYGTFALPMNLEKTVYFGINLKYYSARAAGVPDYQAGGWGTDMGFLLKLPLPSSQRFGKEVAFGLMVEDLSTHLHWNSGARERIATRVRGGMAYHFSGNIVAEIDVESFTAVAGGARIITDDLGHPVVDTLGNTLVVVLDPKVSKLHSGLEGWFFRDKLGLRVGYVGSSTLHGRYSAGGSYRAYNWNLDYAFLGQSEFLGASHRISLCLRFGTAVGRKGVWVPQNLRYSIEDDGMLYLIWDKPQGMNLAGYNIYYTTVPGTNYKKIKSLVKDSWTPLSGFQDGLTVYVAVTSVLTDGVTESKPSPEIEINYSQALAPPEIIAPVQQQAILPMSWRPQAGVFGYNVYFCEFKDGDYVQVNDELIKTTSYRLSDPRFRLKVGKKYWVKIKSVGADGRESSGIPQEIPAAPAQ